MSSQRGTRVSGARTPEGQWTQPREVWRGHSLQGPRPRKQQDAHTRRAQGAALAAEGLGHKDPDPHCSGSRGPSPHPQLLGDPLPLQVAVRGRDGLQLIHFLVAPLLLVDARVFPVLPELLDLLRAAATFKLHRETQPVGTIAVRAAAGHPGSGSVQRADTRAAKTSPWLLTQSPRPCRASRPRCGGTSGWGVGRGSGSAQGTQA